MEMEEGAEFSRTKTMLFRSGRHQHATEHRRCEGVERRSKRRKGIQYPISNWRAEFRFVLVCWVKSRAARAVYRIIDVSSAFAY